MDRQALSALRALLAHLGCLDWAAGVLQAHMQQQLTCSCCLPVFMARPLRSTAQPLGKDHLNSEVFGAILMVC